VGCACTVHVADFAKVCVRLCGIVTVLVCCVKKEKIARERNTHVHIHVHVIVRVHACMRLRTRACTCARVQMVQLCMRVRMEFVCAYNLWVVSVFKCLPACVRV